MAENQENQTPNRAAVYIDGFNLYHPVNEMGEPFLKWCNLWRLSELMCEARGLALQKVTFCTAVPLHLPASRDRHNTFNAALRAHGVTVVRGHHVYDPDAQKYSEKQSDINVALSLIMDAVDNVFDWAILVSADSDQAATARTLKERFPEKRLLVAAPPNRRPPDKCMPYAEASFTITKLQIESAVMPQFVPTQGGGFIRRPDTYDPPEWWMHPDQRPKRNR